MAITRCENGHYYDDKKFDACPHCRDNMDSPLTKQLEATVAMQAAAEQMSANSDDEKTVAGNVLAEHQIVANAGQQFFDMRAQPDGSDEKTVGLFKKKHGHDPVTGWLVCMKGPERGRDYRLHSGRNFIGRAPNMDIAITGDEQVSRENHCSVVFDPKKFTFMLVPGAVTYLNAQATAEPAVLNASDIIGIGSSEFVFVPFCIDGRGWENE